jgi:anion transporter
VKDIDFSRIPLFSGLVRTELAKLIPHLERVEFAAEEVIVGQGDVGDSLFIIVEGEASVWVSDDHGGVTEISHLHGGDAFGEMALLTGAPRSATVKAESDLTALRLLKERFEFLLRKEQSVAVHVANLLAKRLYAKNVPLAAESASTEETDASHAHRAPSLQAPLSLKESLLTLHGWMINKKLLGLALIAVLCTSSALVLRTTTISWLQLVLFEILLAATVCWSLNIFSYHAVAIALPVMTVLFGVATPQKAFLGFSSSIWFLVVGVLAITGALQKTGLMYRFLLMVVKRTPPSYYWQIFTLTLAGVVLTPIIPSSGSRAVMAGPVMSDLSEILGFKKDSPGAVGLGMASLLGFVSMSFLFLNGMTACLLALGLLPAEVRATITWSSWFTAALPLGLLVLAGSYLAIIGLHHPREPLKVTRPVLEAQLRTLGPLTVHERISLIVVVICLAGFMTQSWFHIEKAWVAMVCFLILFATSVLDEKAVRTDIDWTYAISFGAVVGFGDLISESGLATLVAGELKPYLELFLGNDLVFLLALSLAVFLIRFLLPLSATLVVTLLSIVPLGLSLGVNPFVIALVTLVSANPWILPYQNIFFCLMLEATEGKIFTHKHTARMAFAHVGIVLAAIALTVPYWRYMGLIR